jgi:hypothetical protein
MWSKLLILFILATIDYIVKQFKPTEVEKERQLYAEKIANIVNNFNNGNMGYVLLPFNKDSKWGSAVIFGDRMEPRGNSPDKQQTGNSAMSDEKGSNTNP